MIGGPIAVAQNLSVPQLIRNYTPEAWHASELNWIRDQQPKNKIDDLIDNSDMEDFDVVVNYRRCTTPEDVLFLSRLSLDSAAPFRLKYLSSISVNRLTRNTLEELAHDSGIAFIEMQVGFSTLLDVSLPALGVTAGARSPNTLEDLYPLLDGSGVNIAIIDSGVDNAVHNAFPAAHYVAGYDALTQTFVDPDDDIGHGTHVASIALGSATGAVPRGMAPGAGLIDIRVVDAATVFCGTPGQWPRIVDGLQQVYDNRSAWNVHVINMSLGQCSAAGPVASDGLDAFSQLVDLADAMNIVVVAAAGNSFPNGGVLPTPAAATRALTVAASDDLNTQTLADDTIAVFSNAGPRADDGDSDLVDELKPEVTAPGVSIVGARFDTANGSLALSGTSMAAPHVAGLAALIIQAKPGITAGAVKDLIIRSANILGQPPSSANDPTWNARWGWGVIDAFAAIDLAIGADLTFPSYPPSPGWLSPDISVSPSPAKVGVPTTITAKVRNNGPNLASGARVNFGVHVFAASTPTFYDIGTRIVDIPVNPLGSTSVSMPWTPQAASHQCLRVELNYGPDSDFSNNSAQRNVAVQTSPARFWVKNTVADAPTRIRLVTRLDDPNRPWDLQMSASEVTLSAQDCAEAISIELFPPGDAQPGLKQTVHVAAVVDTLLGPVEIGGVSVDAYPDVVLPELGWQKIGGELRLFWSGSAVLQKALSVDGQFEDVAGASSSYPVEFQGAEAYYRLRAD